MLTFALKPKATEQAAPENSPKLGQVYGAQSRDGNSILQLQRTIGNQALQRMLRSNTGELDAVWANTASPHLGYDIGPIPASHPVTGATQAKPAIDTPEDEYEREAERVAERGMRIPEFDPPVADDPLRAGRNETISKDEAQRSRAKPVGGPGTIAGGLSGFVAEVPHSPGQPLPPATRAFFEPRFGYDFSQVRIHTDEPASTSTGRVSARAYTVKSHIFFGTGEWSPRAVAGQRLLAHELTHTIQQGASVPLEKPGVSNAAAPLFKVRAPTSSCPWMQRKLSLIGTDIQTAQKIFNAKYFHLEEKKRPYFIAVRTKGSTPPTALIPEILWCLARSRKEVGPTLKQLALAVGFRRSVVESAKALGKKPAQFGSFNLSNPFDQNKFKVNERMWQLSTIVNESTKKYDIVITSRRCIKPSAAIRDIYDHPELYAYECFSASAFIQLHALLLRVRHTNFDKAFKRIRLTFPEWNPGAIVLQFSKFGLEEDTEATKKENDYRELIPGDQTTLQGAGGFNENVIYVGHSKFFAQDKGIATVPEIAEHYKKPKLKLTSHRWRPKIEGQFL